MTDITKSIPWDEEYTIVENTAPVAPIAPSGLSTSAIGGYVFGASSKLNITVNRVSVTQPKIVLVNRYIRDKVKVLKVIEPELAEDALLAKLKQSVDKKVLMPDKQVPFYPGTKVLISERNLELMETEKKFGVRAVAMNTGGIPEFTKRKEKTQLGVQRAMVFQSSEQIQVERLIQKQKKEMREDLKIQAKKIDSLQNALVKKERQRMGLQMRLEQISEMLTGMPSTMTMRAAAGRELTNKEIYNTRAAQQAELKKLGYSQGRMYVGPSRKGVVMSSESMIDDMAYEADLVQEIQQRKQKSMLLTNRKIRTRA